MASPRPYLAHTPIALAHRGGALFAPNVGLENTLTAFGHAVALGYTHLETDVHLTRDGRLVAFHDSRLDRVSDLAGRIRDLPWDQVRSARLGPGPEHDRVPLLVEVLEAFPGICLNIDLKAPGTARPLWDLVEQHGLHDRVCVGSFQPQHLSQFRRLARGSVVTAAGVPGTALLRFSPDWLTALLHTPAEVLQVPASLPLGSRRLQLVTERFVASAHRHGKQVHVWTIDDEDEMRRLLDLGVDGLVTDRIEVLKDVLVERGAWTGAH
jgi:glycerophosphoryl diester phosphodiesterase